MQLWIVAMITLLSRIPFLFAGYGAEEDSWGTVLAAHNTAATGVYEASRLPGHPVQELIYSVLHDSSPFVFNGLTAFCSVITVMFFFLALKELGFRSPIIASLAFAFVPVVFISSSYTIDYMWAMAFAMMSFYFLTGKKFLWSGIVLGIAIGCRVSTGALLLPFCMQFYEKGSKENLKNILQLTLVSIITGFICFIPVIKIYGWNFLIAYDQFPQPFAKAAYKATIGVFGLIGMLALIFFSALILFRRNNFSTENFFPELKGKKYFLAWMIAVVLFVVAYIRLPQKSGYLIPAIPSIILLFGKLLSRKNFFILCALLILSSFCCSINLTDKLRGAEFSSHAIKFNAAGQEIFFDPFASPVFADYSKRKQKINFTEKVISRVKEMKPPAAILCGYWLNEIRYEMISRKINTEIKLEFYPDETQLKKYKEENTPVYFLPEINKFNDIRYKMNVTDSLAQPLFADEE